MDKLSFIIINYKTPETTLDCIESIKKHIKSIDFEIIVVDNNSEDDSKTIIQSKYQDIKWVSLLRNYGYGYGVNRGFELSEGNYITILNSDIIIKSDYMIDLVKFYKTNDAGLLGVKLILPDQETQRTFGYFPSPMVIIANETSLLGKIKSRHFARYAAIKSKNPETQRVDWVTGAFMFISRDNFNSIEGFDEKFFMYYEDVDICRQITQKKLPVYYISEYSAVHKHCATIKSLPQTKYIEHKINEIRSGLYYLSKYYSKYLTVTKFVLSLIFLCKTTVMGIKYFLFIKTEKRNKNARKFNTFKRILRVLRTDYA